MHSVTHYRLMEYKTNEATVISYLDHLLNKSHKTSLNLCKHKSLIFHRMENRKCISYLEVLLFMLLRVL